MTEHSKSVGIILVTHGRLADEFLRAAEEIMKENLEILTVSLSLREDAEDARRRILGAVQEAEKGRGVLIITDMFGGTPTNICLSLLEEDNIEVLTGLNLPMLLKLVTARRDMALRDLARCLQECGRENINLASEILGRTEGR